MDLSKIITISGKPGLYKVISQSKNAVFVESLTEPKRIPVFSNEKMSSLGEISVFTEGSDIELKEVFRKIFAHEEAKEIENLKQKSVKDLITYFEVVLPEYDRDRVYNSDIKKILSWYNILVSLSLIDNEEPNKEDTEAASV